MASEPTLSKASSHEKNWATRLFHFKFTSSKEKVKCSTQEKTKSEPCTPTKNQPSQQCTPSHHHRVLLSSPIGLSTMQISPRMNGVQQENVACKTWPLSIQIADKQVGTVTPLSQTTLNCTTFDQQICGACMSAPATPAFHRQIINQEETSAAAVVTRHLPRYRRRMKCATEELHYTFRKRHSSLPDKRVFKVVDAANTVSTVPVKPRTRLLRSSVPSVERLQTLRQSFAPKLKEMQEIGPQRYLAVSDDKEEDEDEQETTKCTHDKSNCCAQQQEVILRRLCNVKLKSSATS